MREELERMALQRVSALADAPAEERDAALRTAEREDPELARAMRELLAFLREADVAMAEVPADAMPPPGHIGPYRLVERIGRGGMGEVWRAERDDGQYRRTVALKRIWSGMVPLAGRFVRERQVLARLRHPHIAQLFDGGVDAQAQPWFAMELVEGEPITRWCDARRLPLGARVELFRQVCDAVAYAHRNLVVHRDIKPGNVLVDADGQAKLLDFGIAGEVDGSDADPTEPAALTPAWAAPEQRLTQGVTTASDIYQLGVLLRVLLCGQAGDEDTRRQPMSEAFAALQIGEPTQAQAIAKARGVLPAQLGRALRGGLDGIVLRATAGDPASRYATVGELSDDLLRWGALRPLRGVRETLRVRTGKFIRRNRNAVVASVLAVLALLGTGGYAIHNLREQLFLSGYAKANIRFTTELLTAMNAGDRAQAERTLDIMRQRLPQMLREYRLSGESLGALEATLGLAYRDIGSDAKAAAVLAEAVRDGAPLRARFPSHHVLAVAGWAETLAANGRVAQAQQVLDAEFAWQAAHPRVTRPQIRAELWRVQALVAGARGDVRHQVRALDNAAALARGASGAVAEGERARIECDIALLRSPDAGAAPLHACVARMRGLPLIDRDERTARRAEAAANALR